MPSNGLFVNSRYKLLTYAQCGDLDPFDIVDLLSGLQGECIVGRELHSDGGIHLHVFVDFGRKFRSRSVGIFDVGGRHPNVVASWGTPEEGYDYAIKDGDVVAGGLERPTPRESRAGNGSAAAKWATIADADDREQFFELVKSLDPKTFVTRLQDLQRFADWKFRSDPEPYVTPNNIHFPDDGTDGRAEWVRQSGIGLGEPFIGKCPLLAALPTLPSGGRSKENFLRLARQSADRTRSRSPRLPPSGGAPTPPLRAN